MMEHLKRNFVLLCVASTGLKLMLMKSYRSTDFEVHRNWLAITSSLPLKEWYLSDISEWTLDYPPFFAWFEWMLSFFAPFFDEKMLVLHNLNYASSGTVLFQRLSVIVTDALYFFSVYKAICLFLRKGFLKQSGLAVSLYASLFIFNFAFFVVDHIHFQYNGFLNGLWILSLVAILEEKWIAASFWFSILLNMKHIYLYVAPAYFAHILRSCFVRRKKGNLWMNFQRLFQVTLTVLTVFAISFGPFIQQGVLFNVIARLFPFKRGLCHAYWAPNVWAVYNIADKASYYALRLSGGVKANQSLSVASMTGGMVKEYDHLVLPTIRPIHTMVVTLLLMMPILWKLFGSKAAPKGTDFLKAVVLCAWTSFLFGWHVHEKAIMMVTVPMILLLPMSDTHRSTYFLVSTVGHYSLLPLIFTKEESVFKVAFLLVFIVGTFVVVNQMESVKADGSYPRILRFFPRLAYLVGILVLFVFTDCMPDVLGVHSNLPFLPLLLTSVYCSIGVIYGYFVCYVNFCYK